MQTITRVKTIGWLNILVIVLAALKLTTDLLVVGVVNFLIVGIFISSCVVSYLNRQTKLEMEKI